MTATSILETYIGYSWGKSPEVSQGRAHKIALSNLFGIGYGFGFGFAYLKNLLNQPTNLTIGSCGLLSSLMGIVVGNFYNKNLNYTEADATIVTNIGLVGAYLPIIYPAFAGDNTNYKFYVGMILVSSATGLLIGNKLVSDKNFTGNQGVLMGLGTLAGGLTGIALGELIAGNPGASILGGVGAIFGFATIYNNYLNNPKAQNNLDEIGTLNFNFNPAGLTSSLFNKQLLMQLVNPKVHVPVLELSYRF